MLVVPAEALNEILLPPVAEQFEMVRLDRMNAELSRFARADTARPGVTEKPIGQQAEMIRPVGPRRHVHTF